MDYLPLFLQLRSQPALVVGGGRVAVRKVDLLLKSGSQVTVVAPELREELRKLAASGQLQHIPARFEAAHVDGAVIVITATNDHDAT